MEKYSNAVLDRMRAHIDFVKMEGTGNDYVYFDALAGPLPSFSTQQIARISDRRFGVGGDGVVVIGRSDRADARMHMWNADGSPSDMCGNALRCVALVAARHLGKDRVLLESGVGLHEVRLRNVTQDFAEVQVDMGAPAFEASRIPVDLAKLTDAPAAEPIVNLRVSWQGVSLFANLVSMGNPHCVFFVDDPESFPVLEAGPFFEHHPAFPARTNVEFVSVQSDGTLTQRTYERGSGETLSCGSGACAALVASVLTSRGPQKNIIHLRGGDLTLEWTGLAANPMKSPGTVFMTGPAREVFRGVLAGGWIDS